MGGAGVWCLGLGAYLLFCYARADARIDAGAERQKNESGPAVTSSASAASKLPDEKVKSGSPKKAKKDKKAKAPPQPKEGPEEPASPESSRGVTDGAAAPDASAVGQAGTSAIVQGAAAGTGTVEHEPRIGRDADRGRMTKQDSTQAQSFEPGSFTRSEMEEQEKNSYEASQMNSEASAFFRSGSVKVASTPSSRHRDRQSSHVNGIPTKDEEKMKASASTKLVPPAAPDEAATTKTAVLNGNAFKSKNSSSEAGAEKRKPAVESSQGGVGVRGRGLGAAGTSTDRTNTGGGRDQDTKNMTTSTGTASSAEKVGNKAKRPASSEKNKTGKKLGADSFAMFGGGSAKPQPAEQTASHQKANTSSQSKKESGGGNKADAQAEGFYAGAEVRSTPFASPLTTDLTKELAMTTGAPTAHLRIALAARRHVEFLSFRAEISGSTLTEGTPFNCLQPVAKHLTQTNFGAAFDAGGTSTNADLDSLVHGEDLPYGGSGEASVLDPWPFLVRKSLAADFLAVAQPTWVFGAAGSGARSAMRNAIGREVDFDFGAVGYQLALVQADEEAVATSSKSQSSTEEKLGSLAREFVLELSDTIPGILALARCDAVQVLTGGEKFLHLIRTVFHTHPVLLHNGGDGMRLLEAGPERLISVPPLTKQMVQALCEQILQKEDIPLVVPKKQSENPEFHLEYWDFAPVFEFFGGHTRHLRLFMQELVALCKDQITSVKPTDLLEQDKIRHELQCPKNLTHELLRNARHQVLAQDTLRTEARIKRVFRNVLSEGEGRVVANDATKTKTAADEDQSGNSKFHLMESLRAIVHKIEADGYVLVREDFNLKNRVLLALLEERLLIPMWEPTRLESPNKYTLHCLRIWLDFEYSQLSLKERVAYNVNCWKHRDGIQQSFKRIAQ
eukprot:g4916.t1